MEETLVIESSKSNTIIKASIESEDQLYAQQIKKRLEDFLIQILGK